MEEEKEKQRRRKHLMFYKVKELMSKDVETRRKHDEEQIREVMNYLKIDDVEVKQVK